MTKLGHAAVLCVLVLCATAARAHEVRPAYLGLHQLDATTWDVVFKVPARGDRRLGLYARLPEACTTTEPRARAEGGGHVERWRATCDAGLVGGRVTIEGLPLTRTDVLVRVERADGGSQTVRLTPDTPDFVVAGSSEWTAVAGTYLVLGVEHILLGIDHLLFVLALLFLVGSGRRLVATVTAFTVAHSLTLAAATLGLVHVPQAPVEATIALSIVFVATEMLRGADGHAGLSTRRPWLVAFAFGLLHGLGFAGALSEVGLPDDAIPTALLFFNVGVEVGQLVFVGGVIALLAALARLAGRFEGGPFALAERVVRPAAYAIGIPAAFWLIQRSAGFFA